MKYSQNIGKLMHKLLSELFPINRSITGKGVRDTLSIISREIPIKTTKIKSKSKVFDWTIPDEWNVTEAKICTSSGEVVVDFLDNNLYLMSYSTSVDSSMSLSDLKKHIITDKSRPNWVPYSTSYYEDNWAFCLPYNFVKKLNDDNYQVKIEATKKSGHLEYAEAFINNNAKKEILISSYICHPSMANDSLSGVVLSVQLFKEISKLKNLNYNYRFLFAPETIGTISFLYNNKKTIKKSIEFGLVATCIGDKGKFTYKKTRNGICNIDRVINHIFNGRNDCNPILDFSPLGSDERQYCSPGFDLPVGVLTRSIFGKFKEYHTSADNLEFVKDEYLKVSLDLYLEIVKIYEANCIFYRKEPHCEPQMGKYDLYRTIGGGGEDNINELSQQRMWILNYADNETDLLEISQKSGFDVLTLKHASEALVENKLIFKKI